MKQCPECKQYAVELVDGFDFCNNCHWTEDGAFDDWTTGEAEVNEQLRKVNKRLKEEEQQKLANKDLELDSSDDDYCEHGRLPYLEGCEYCDISPENDWNKMYKEIFG